MYVYGKNVANEMLDDNKKINQVFVMYNFKEKELLDKINRKHIPIKELPKVELDKKVPGLHQGIILDIPDYQYASLDDILVNENPLLVILDHIVDPHNLGAIIRTCEAAGVDGIIIPKDRSVSVNGTVLKTSVGTAERMKIVEVSNIVNVIKKLKKDGFWIVGTDMDGTDYTKIDYHGKCAIVCGNEGEGMSRLVQENCDFIASIPMKGHVNSLNASVATGIVIFEAIKGRN